MKVVKLSFLGSGAARNIGLGFIPDFVKIRNVTDAALCELTWDRGLMGSVVAYEGLVATIASSHWDTTLLTKGLGIVPYLGGDRITAAAATNLLAVDQIVGTMANPYPPYAGDMRGKGTAGTVTGWTLDTPANRTGHFNVAVDTGSVGVGSRVRIGGLWYSIVAFTGTGAAADNVTLNASAPTSPQGTVSPGVDYITFMYDLYFAAVGMKMPAGIVLNEVTLVNASGKLCVLEAGIYDV